MKMTEDGGLTNEATDGMAQMMAPVTNGSVDAVAERLGRSQGSFDGGMGIEQHCWQQW